MKQHAAESLFQTIPPLYPTTPFPSIDYVAKPFADILDAIASVLILWTTAAIVGRLLTVPFGKSTRTIVLKRIFDRLVNLSFASCRCVTTRTYHNRRSFTFSGVLLRVTAVLFFLLLGGAEILVIFSQTYQHKTRSLNDLNLKSPTFGIPHNHRERTGHFEGCVPLLSSERTSTSLVLALCMYREYGGETTAHRRAGFEFEFWSSDDRFFGIHETQAFVDIYHTLSVEIRDPSSSARFYANMTRLRFSMTASKLQWLSSRLNEICPSCQVSSDYVSASYSVIRSDINPIVDQDGMDVGIRFSDSVQSMLRLSDRTLQVNDFISENPDRDDKKLPLIEMTSGRVKRVSGLTLWIALAALGVLNFVTSRVTHDLDADVNDAVAKVLARPPGTSLLDCPNVRFRIVNINPNQTG